jgi:hypothetical protein
VCIAIGAMQSDSYPTKGNIMAKKKAAETRTETENKKAKGDGQKAAESKPKKISHPKCSSDLVVPESACPKCGEREVDRLVWLDDMRVECQRCKEIYEPEA